MTTLRLTAYECQRQRQFGWWRGRSMQWTNAAIAWPLTLVKPAETLALDWLNTNERQKRAISSITLLNTISRKKMIKKKKIQKKMIKNNKKYKKNDKKQQKTTSTKKKTKNCKKTQTNKQTKPITRHKTISWSDATPCVSGDDLCTGCTKGQSLRKTVLFRTLPTTDEHTPKYKTIIKKKKKQEPTSRTVLKPLWSRWRE